MLPSLIGLRLGEATCPPCRPCPPDADTGVVVRYRYDPSRPPEEARRLLFADAKDAAPANSELARGEFDNKQDVVTPGVESDGTIVDPVLLTPWEDGDEIFVSSACGHGILKSVAVRPGGLPLLRVDDMLRFTCPVCRVPVKNDEWAQPPPFGLGLSLTYDQEVAAYDGEDAEDDDAEDDDDGSDEGAPSWLDYVVAMPAALRPVGRYRYEDLEDESRALRVIRHADGVTVSTYDGPAGSERLQQRTVRLEMVDEPLRVHFAGAHGEERVVGVLDPALKPRPGEPAGMALFAFVGAAGTERLTNVTFYSPYEVVDVPDDATDPYGQPFTLLNYHKFERPDPPPSDDGGGDDDGDGDDGGDGGERPTRLQRTGMKAGRAVYTYL